MKLGVTVYAVRGYQVVEVLDSTPGSKEVNGFVVIGPHANRSVVFRSEPEAVLAAKALSGMLDLDVPE